MENPPLTVSTKQLLTSQPSPFDYQEFESQLGRALQLFDESPDEVRHGFALSMNPRDFGPDPHSSIIGLFEEQESYLNLIAATYAHKVHELACGIAEGLNCQRLRIAITCARTLFEEAAAATYYTKKAVAPLQKMLSIPPSSFRPKRLERWASVRSSELTDLLNTLFKTNEELRRWYHAGKLNWLSTDLYRNYERDKNDPLRSGFTLSALKEIEWEGKPTSFFYAVLCEAVHPNADASMLYAEVSNSGNGRQEFVLRKQRKSAERIKVAYVAIRRPTIECIKILDECITVIHSNKDRIQEFIRKIKQA